MCETHRRHFCSINRETSRYCRGQPSSRCRPRQIALYSPNEASWAADNHRNRRHRRRRSWCTWKTRPRNCKKFVAQREAFIIYIYCGCGRYIWTGSTKTRTECRRKIESTPGKTLRAWSLRVMTFQCAHIEARWDMWLISAKYFAIWAYIKYA